MEDRPTAQQHLAASATPDARIAQAMLRPPEPRPRRPSLVLGIDEAGRGPVLGPLVVAGVAHRDLGLFAQLGCTDSKLLAPEKRRAIDRALRASPARIAVRVIEAATLDAERRQGRSLNDIELQRFQEIARELDATQVIVDAADVDARRFGRQLGAVLVKGTKVVSQHKADLNHPVVGAASIVAKVARDAAVTEMARRLERVIPLPLGSGYASDPNTQAFLQAWHKQFGDLPEGTRMTWAPAQAILAPKPVALESFL